MNLTDIKKGLEDLSSYIRKDRALSIIQKAVNSDEIPEDILIKAKYIRRTGTKGNYKYIYEEGSGRNGGKKVGTKKKKISIELVPKEGQIVVYRGTGSNVGKGINRIEWVAKDKSVAENYGAVTKTIIEMPKSIFSFPYRKNPDSNREVEVKGFDIGNLIRDKVKVAFKSKEINRDNLSGLLNKIKEYENLAGEKSEPYPDKINKEGASKKMVEILSELGYDSIEIIENNKEGNPTKTYGIFKGIK